MIYPIATIYGDNDIEITSSRPKQDGSIIVNIEKWTPVINNFSNLQIKLPQQVIVKNENFSDEDVKNIFLKICALSNEILEYVYEIDKNNNYIDNDRMLHFFSKIYIFSHKMRGFAFFLHIYRCKLKEVNN